jgi:glycerol kinase
MECVAAIDHGTTSSRAIIYALPSMTPLASHQLEHTQHHPQPGWCEHDADEIVRNVRQCLDQAHGKAVAAAAAQGAPSVTVKALGLTNQRETTLVWDKLTGAPLHKAVVWLDTRTAALCQKLEAEFGSKVRAGVLVSSAVWLVAVSCE